MFLSAKPCLHEETKGSDSDFVIGILVVTVLSICVIIAMGCWGILNSNQDDSYLINSGFSLNVFESPSGNEKFVTIAQSKSYDNVDTAKGYIQVIGELLPDWSILPLCIKDSDLLNYFVDLKVVGGYVPVDYCSWTITFSQDRNNDKSTKEYIGTINIIPAYDEARSGCCWSVYHLTFDVFEDCIHIDSNYFPDVPAGWDLTPNCGATDLNKLVDVDITTKWEGCGCEDQRFEIILSQKKIFYFRSPQLP